MSIPHGAKFLAGAEHDGMPAQNIKDPSLYFFWMVYIEYTRTSLSRKTLNSVYNMEKSIAKNVLL